MDREVIEAIKADVGIIVMPEPSDGHRTIHLEIVGATEVHKEHLKAAILSTLEEQDVEVEVDFIDELNTPKIDYMGLLDDHEPCQSGDFGGPVDWNNGRGVDHVAPFHTRNKRDVYRQNNAMQVSGKKWKR